MILKARKALKVIQNQFVYGGHLTSLASVSVVFTSAILLNIKITCGCLAVIYLDTYSVYLYNFYKEFRSDILTNPKRCQHLKIYFQMIPLIIIFSVLVSAGILLYFDKIYALLLNFFLLFIGFSYSIFFKKLTKKIIAFKNLFVSFSWTLLILFLIVYYSFPLNFSVFLILIFIYLRVFIREIFLDIRDIKSDTKKQLLVLPSVFEKNKLINILFLISTLSFIPIIFGSYFKLFPEFSLMLLFLVPYSLYCSKKTKSRKVNVNFLYNILIEGEYILWLPLILLGKFLFSFF